MTGSGIAISWQLAVKQNLQVKSKYIMDGRTISPTKIRKIEPEVYAQTCPTCNGFGTLKHGTKICNGCNGKTWILVPIRMDGGKNYGSKD